MRDGFLCEEKEKAQEASLEEVQVQIWGACPGPPQLPMKSLPLGLLPAPRHFPNALIYPPWSPCSAWPQSFTAPRVLSCQPHPPEGRPVASSTAVFGLLEQARTWASFGDPAFGSTSCSAPF